MFSLCSNIKSTTSDYDKEQMLPLTLLKPAEQAHCNTWHFAPFIQECISMAAFICAHGTTIPTNCEPSELVAKHITQTII